MGRSVSVAYSFNSPSSATAGICLTAGSSNPISSMTAPADPVAASSSREISEAVKAALARDPDADVLYVHDEDGQALAALVPIEVWRRELTPPEEVRGPFDTYTHGHITPQDDDE